MANMRQDHKFNTDLGTECGGPGIMTCVCNPISSSKFKPWKDRGTRWTLSLKIVDVAKRSD